MVSDEKLESIPAFLLQGITDYDVLLTGQQVLRLLLDTNTRDLQELPIKGEYVQIFWCGKGVTEQVKWSTVTLPPDTGDECSSSFTSQEKC